MIDHIFNLFGRKKNAKNTNNSDEIVGFIPSFEEIEDFKKEHNLNCPARTVGKLIKYLESRPNQKWYVFKSLKRKPFLINVGVYEEFPSIDTALEWSEVYGGGKYYVKPLSLGKCKIGFYEFEGEDKFPENEDRETGITKTNPYLKKFKPRNLKEAILLQKIQEGDEKAISKITNEEEDDKDTEGDIKALYERVGMLSEQLQEKEQELKEALKKIEDLKDESHKKDLQILEERFMGGATKSTWDGLAKVLDTDTGKELAKEGMETLKEIAKASKGGKEEDQKDEVFDERKSLPPAGKPAKNNWKPLILLYRFIEQNGDPNAYIETISVQYPSHAFSQWLITIESTEQFLEKFKSAQEKLPLLYSEQGRTWLDGLFEVIRDLNAQSEKVVKKQAEAESLEPAHASVHTGSSETELFGEKKEIETKETESE